MINKKYARNGAFCIKKSTKSFYEGFLREEIKNGERIQKVISNLL